ncbi:MAG: hypothetical protein ILP12_02505 [Lachnospiraceae bacterium]|nr:hypothetical protein [Lachnospiraceae bacterium]
MADSVILSSPALFVAALASVGLLLFIRHSRAGGFVLTVLAALAALGVLFAALLSGASWEELIVLLLLDTAVLLIGGKGRER